MLRRIIIVCLVAIGCGDPRADAPPDAALDPRCTVCNAPWGTLPRGCTDVRVDYANCGACDSVCRSGTCAAGVCVERACNLSCGAGSVCCGNSCTNPNRDIYNCGACGHACAAREACDYGECVCESPLALCGLACIDVQTDPSNCGACGNVCASGSCINGYCQSCISVGQVVCGLGCANLLTSHDHCGACDHACSANEACVNGICTVGDGASCATSCGALNQVCCAATSTCVDLNTNTNNCGACGASCGGTCRNGNCFYGSD